MALTMYEAEILDACPEVDPLELSALTDGGMLIRSTERFGMVEIEYDDALGMFEVARV